MDTMKGDMSNIDISKIKEHMMIHAKGGTGMEGTSEVHIGTVDHMEGDKHIKMTKKDATDDKHHWITIDWVESVDDKGVHLNKTKDEVMSMMMDTKPTS